MPRVLIDFTLPIPEELREADETMTRYGRWAMDRFRKQRCASAEGAYQIPPNDDDREPRESIMPAFEAVAVMRALQKVPEPQRKVLDILYVPRKLSVQAQLRMAQLTPRTCQERHRAGLRMFWNRMGVMA